MLVWLTIIAVVLTAGALIALIRSENQHMRELEEVQPVLALLRKRIKEQIRNATKTCDEYELSDPRSADTLKIATPPKSTIDSMMSPQKVVEIKLITHQASYGARPTEITTTVFRLPGRSVEVHYVALPWSGGGSGRQVREQKRIAWQNPCVATVEELIELERKLTTWQPSPIQR